MHRCGHTLCTSVNGALCVVESGLLARWPTAYLCSVFAQLECVMRLVQVGCGVNAVTSRFAQTPTHIAAFGGHPECLRWLLQAGADVNRQVRRAHSTQASTLAASTGKWMCNCLRCDSRAEGKSSIIISRRIIASLLFHNLLYFPNVSRWWCIVRS